MVGYKTMVQNLEEYSQAIGQIAVISSYVASDTVKARKREQSKLKVRQLYNTITEDIRLLYAEIAILKAELAQHQNENKGE